MSLRGRLTLVAAGVVAVVVLLASLTTYLVMRHELYAQVDASLRNDAGVVNPNNLATPEGFPGNLVAIFDSHGASQADNVPGGVSFDSSMRAVADGQRQAFFQDAVGQTSATRRLREFVAPI